MQIKESGGYIFVHLEESDFQNHDWRSFINELKAISDEYKEDIESWCITDTIEHRKELSRLIKKYFKNENQAQLF